MRKRLFISINPPREAQEALLSDVNAISKEFPKDLHPRFTDRQSTHFTIIFLDSQEESLIPLITGAMDKSILGFKPFTVRIRNIDYAPGGQSKRMIWARGASPEMNLLARKVREEIGKINLQLMDSKGFNPHITLARFNSQDETDLPKISKETDISFIAESIKLMESVLSSSGGACTGREYKEIYSADFSGK